MRLRVTPFVLLKRLALRLLLIAVVFWGEEITLFSMLPVPFSMVMLERQVSAWLSGDVRCLTYSDWVGMDEISPRMELAVIAAEDQKFPEHQGLDVSATERALTHDKRHDTRVCDASTLSQQTAKNLFLWDGRNWLRKGLEAGLTVGIETIWSKKRILTIYLSIAEFDDGISGVETAAQRYFRKPASQLTPGETALLAAVLPNPIRYRADTPSGYMHSRQAWILRQMRRLGGEGLIREHKLY